jgi:hypothetical protein
VADQDPDERFSIEGDPEDALRGLLSGEPGGKEAKLAYLRTAPSVVMEDAALLDAAMQEALEAGASRTEIREAVETPR